MSCKSCNPIDRIEDRQAIYDEAFDDGRKEALSGEGPPDPYTMARHEDHCGMGEAKHEGYKDGYYGSNHDDDWAVEWAHHNCSDQTGARGEDVPL